MTGVCYDDVLSTLTALKAMETRLDYRRRGAIIRDDAENELL